MPVAFISGSGQGIGRGIAIRLAEDGFDIAINDIPGKDVSEVLERIKETGRTAITVPANVAVLKDVQEAVEKTVKELGGLDVMVANAGVLEPANFLDVTEEQIDRLLSINVKGVFNCLQVAAKQLITQGRGGRLIAASSEAGVRGAALLPMYSATKFAVRGLVQSIAKDVGKYNITVNCYCPTFVATPMVAGNGLMEIAEAYNKALPISRLGEVDDVAHAVSFLASEKASFITGISLSIDGGASC